MTLDDAVERWKIIAKGDGCIGFMVCQGIDGNIVPVYIRSEAEIDAARDNIEDNGELLIMEVYLD